MIPDPFEDWADLFDDYSEEHRCSRQDMAEEFYLGFGAICVLLFEGLALWIMMP